jgi:hypothetical protein
MRCLVMVAVVVVLSAVTTSAQMLPGDSPRFGIGEAVSNSRSRPLLGISHRSQPARTEYESGSARLPASKPSKDPWAGIRQAPTASSADRHGPQ